MLAPTNEAFDTALTALEVAAVLNSSLAITPELLTTILTYHVSLSASKALAAGRGCCRHFCFA